MHVMLHFVNLYGTINCRLRVWAVIFLLHEEGMEKYPAHRFHRPEQVTRKQAVTHPRQSYFLQETPGEGKAGLCRIRRVV
jgi:hypothetical protein